MMTVYTLESGVEISYLMKKRDWKQPGGCQGFFADQAIPQEKEAPTQQ